jgi:hypothetical protein
MMTIHRVSPRRLAVLAAALAVACSESSAPPDEVADQLTSDLAIVAGDAAYEDVGMIYLHESDLGTPAGDLGRLAGFRDRCPYDPVSQRFVCPPQIRDFLTLMRSYAFADATGSAQSAYDPMTTASANFRSSLTGTVTRDGWTGTIARERDFTVSGLAGNETQHIVNGIGSSAHSRSRHTDAGTRSYSISDVATFTDVVVPFPRTRGAWPLSGTIRRVITATLDGEAGAVTRERIATVTFNGTRFAQLVIGDRTYRLDLATGRIVRGDAGR